MSNRKLGSIALARSLCYQINGAADDSDDIDGGGYGSVDVAEILSAEVVRLREALAQLEQQAAPQRAWVGVTEKDWEYVKDKKGTSLDSFDQGAAWAQQRLQERNNE